MVWAWAGYLFEDDRGGTAPKHALGDRQTRPAQPLRRSIDPLSAVVDQPLVAGWVVRVTPRMHLGHTGEDAEHRIRVSHINDKQHVDSLLSIQRFRNRIG